jgi:hypothetical protein
MPVTVNTSTADMLGLYFTYTRKLFYAKGLFWLFYGNGSNGAFRTSVDGINWSGETTFGYGALGWQFDVIYDNTDYVHVAYGGGADVYYRRGLLNADGTITWSSNWIDTGVGHKFPSIILDSNGYPWIGYQNGIEKVTYVIKNSKKDGTWETADGFPYSLNPAITGDFANALPVALSGGKVFVIYTTVGQKLYGKLYDGAWGAEETLSDYVTNADIDAVAEGDVVHFAYVRYEAVAGKYDVRYNKRNSNGSLDTEISIDSSLTFRTRYSLSLDAETGILYIFYSGATSVRFCRKVGDVLESPIDFAVGEGGGAQPVRAFIKKYSRYIGVAWHKSSPTELRFQSYAVLPSSLKSNSHSL